MKQKLTGLAFCLAVLSNAQADTSVTLYGIADLGLGYESVRGPGGFSQSRTGLVDGVNSGSRFGLRGVEELGGGTRALFVLEGGINLSDGTSGQSGRLFGRRATIGLQNDAWGTLELGRQTNLASTWVGDMVSPFGTSFRTANIGTTFSSANTMRLDNLVLYQSPDIAGWQAGVGYSFNADSTRTDNGGQRTGFGTADNNRVLTTALRYRNGPLYVAAAYDRFNPTSGAVGGQSPARIQSYILAGSYDFEVLKLGLAWGQTRDGWFIGQNMGTSPSEGGFQNLGTFSLRDGFKADSYMVGVTVPFGANALLASWQRADPDNDLLTGEDATMNVYSVGLTHELSRRTNLYAYASYGDNYAFNPDASNRTVVAGVRHRF
ncbi:porin [Orrella sp. JC864]|uniref:porin n=1 Tax=Orrella sp. JC864 TaxID=3120298 RepID=UPI00300B8691